ncbi:hypothetical protein L596_019779 [Steinernema carpocapsae]|uniref:Uncharacterized protein n=1 Tax=Steinernema carpocapsae TaxID=34508 RepID=A0A4U5MRS2_STECR|nr:hypothetical protein L596_019779 [Steinernema carpocapsae]
MPAKGHDFSVSPPEGLLRSKQENCRRGTTVMNCISDVARSKEDEVGPVVSACVNKCTRTMFCAGILSHKDARREKSTLIVRWKRRDDLWGSESRCR